MASTSPGCSQQQPINMRQPGNQSPVTWVPLQKDSSELWIPVQKDQKPFQCGLCSVMFAVNRELVSHIHKHSFTKPYQCGYCKVSYDNNQELTVHVKMHTMFMIQVASSTMEDHVSVGQTDGTPSSQCEPGIMSNKDSSQDSVVSDIDPSVIRSNTDIVVNNVLEMNNGKGIRLEDFDGGEVIKLDKWFQRRGSAETDEKNNGIKGIEKPFCCDLCGATFKAARYVSDHKRRIHNMYSRQTGCNQSHSQDDETEPARSDLCDLELVVQTELCDEYSTDNEKSVEIDHSDTSEAESEHSTQSLVEQVKLTGTDQSDRCRYKPYLCNICNAAFKAPRYIRDHKRRIHKMTNQKQNVHNLQKDHVRQRTVATRRSIKNVAEIAKSCEAGHKNRSDKFEDQTGHCVDSLMKTMKSSRDEIGQCDKSETQTERKVENMKKTVKYTDTDQHDKTDIQEECSIDRFLGQVKMAGSEVVQGEILEVQAKRSMGSLMERAKIAEINGGDISECNSERLKDRAKSVADQGDNLKDKTESRIERLVKGVKSTEHQKDLGGTLTLKAQAKCKNVMEKAKPADVGLANRRKSKNKPFPCNICGATFKAPRYVRDHKRRIHKMSFQRPTPVQVQSHADYVEGTADADKQVKCESSITNVLEGSELVDSDRFEVKTEDRAVSFIFPEDLDGKKRKIRPFSCNICGATFKAARYVRDHKRKIHKISLRRTYQRVPNSQGEGDGLIKLEECTELKTAEPDRRTSKQPFRCNICGATFKVARYVKDHKRRIHNMYCKHSQYYQGDEKDEINNLRPFACPHCPWQFKAKFALQSHVARVHENKRPFVCMHCKDCFKTRRDLAIHERRRHMTEKPHECADCKQAFKVRDDLLQHYCQPKPCPLCNQMLSNHRTYYYHMRHNHRTEPFQCQLCEVNGVLTRREIEMHMKTHPNAKPKSFVCEFCGQAFAKLMTLTYHRNGRHLNIKPYKCSICQKSFNSLPNMRNHKRRHSGDRRYTCDRCGKKFYTSGCLLRHSKTHSDSRDYACAECGATYKKHVNFAYHLKHSHGL